MEIECCSNETLEISEVLWSSQLDITHATLQTDHIGAEDPMHSTNCAFAK
jgi:hypothetical protein